MPRPVPRVSRASRWLVRLLWPNQKLRVTREGIVYMGVWVVLLLTGLWQQINLILLIAGLAAGPVVGSIWSSATMLRRVRVVRRPPPYAFAGNPLAIDYVLDNDRRHQAALALVLSDELTPVDRSVSGVGGFYPHAFFPRVAGRSQAKVRWEGVVPRRGRYRFRTFDLVTRSPFGLLERRVSAGEAATITVYPAVGQLSRRWQQVHRESTETRRGARHDRSVQQQEYHGLRDYRSGDSPKWVHWRTSARLGQLMVKEFEQQHEQDLAILLDPWLARGRPAPGAREAVEEAIGFVATVCLETCRQSGRRLLLGWTGSPPGLRQGPASVKLLHELLEQLATLRANTDGGLAGLLDVVPPSVLRESVLIVVTTRPLNLQAEAEGSTRLPGSAIRGLLGRITLIDAARGDLTDLIQYPTAQRPRNLPRGLADSADYPALPQPGPGSGPAATTPPQPRPPGGSPL